MFYRRYCWIWFIMIYHDISIVNGLHTQMITHVWGTTFHLGPHIQKSGGDLLELNARHLNLQESPIVGYWQQLETIVYNCTTICYNYKNLWTSNAKTTNLIHLDELPGQGLQSILKRTMAGCERGWLGDPSLDSSAVFVMDDVSLSKKCLFCNEFCRYPCHRYIWCVWDAWWLDWLYCMNHQADDTFVFVGVFS